MRPETRHYADSGWSGMNALTPAEKLPPGAAQVIENLLIGQGGKLTTRPGFLGQFTTALGGPIYLATGRVVMPDGTLRLIFASGATTAKLYSFKPGDAAPVEITKTGAVSFAFTSQGKDVRFAFWGRYCFLLDGGDPAAAIWRVDVGAGGSAVSLNALTSPTAAPTATPSFLVLDTLAPASWAVDTGANLNTNIIARPRFNGADNTGSNVGNYWKIISGSGNADCQDTTTYAPLPALTDAADKWLHLDNENTVVTACQDSASTLTYLENGYAENANWSTSTDLRRYCTRFLFKCRAFKAGSAAKSFTVRIQFFYAVTQAVAPAFGVDDAVPLYEYNKEVTISASGKDELVRVYLDLTGQLPSSIHYIRVFLIGAAGGVSEAQGPWVTDVELQALHPDCVLPTNPPVTEAGFALAQTEVPLLSDLYLAFSTATPLVATGINRLGLTLSTRASITPLPSLVFKFANAGGAIWTSPPTLYGDAVSIDITEMPTAIKAGIRKIAMVFLEDATVSGIAVTRTPLTTRCSFYINDLVVPGNLSVGIPYSYRFSDFDADATTYLEGGRESSGSPDSEQVTLTDIQGRMSVTLPSGFSPAGDHFLLWRRGGVLPDSDTRPRLVAMVPVAADAFQANWSWDFATRTFTDNTPDTDLWVADAYQVGRDAPPTGGRCLIVHAQRLFVGRFDATRKVNEVFASWLLDGGTDAGYYFTNTVDPSDPEAEIKGALLRERGDPGDRIQAFESMIPPANTGDMLSAHLLVLREGGPPSSLTGWRGGIGVTGAFSLLAATQEIGGGCIAGQGSAQVDGRVWWAAATGLVTLAGSQIKPVAEHIKPLLSLEPIGKSRYSGAFLLWHDRKALALLPGATSTDGVIYLYDELAPPGSRWVRLAYSVGFVSGISLSGGQDAGQLYLGGRNGQLFLYTGTSDKATPAASAVAITFTLTSRKYGQGESSGPVSALAPQRAHQIVMQVEAGASLALTVTLTGDNAAARTSVWTAPSGVSQPILRSLGDVRGTTHQIDLSGSSTTGASLRSLGLTVTETSTRRG